MKQIFWFILGTMVMIGGQLLADSFVFQDNQGRSGTIQQIPGMQQQDWMGPARIMQQQNDAVLRNSQRNPC